VPAKAKGKTKTVYREVPHSWLVYREGGKLLKRPVRLDTLEVRTDSEPRKAGREAWFWARQMPLPGLDGPRRFVCQEVLEQLRAQRAAQQAGEAAE
jgi:hypothetical protein